MSGCTQIGFLLISLTLGGSWRRLADGYILFSAIGFLSAPLRSERAPLEIIFRVKEVRKKNNY
jgi:hypothetical protein